MSFRHRGVRLAALLWLVAATVSPAAESTDEQRPRHSLWRVRSASNTVYLLGSIHIMRPDAYPLPAVVESAFAASDRAVFEVDLTATDAAGAALGSLSAGVLAGGRTLRDVVSPETFRMTEQRLAAAGLSISLVERMRPWMVATTLALAELERAGYSAADGLDQRLLRRARDAGKSVEGLETMAFQLQLFAGLTPEEDEAFLVQTLRELADVIPAVDELTEHWRDGRLDEVQELLAAGFDDFPGLYDKVVTRRNRSWLPRLEQLLAGSERTFVVVGALHLVGDDGLVEMLRRKGYEVEQL